MRAEGAHGHVWAAQIPALAVAKQRAAAWPVHKAMLIEMAPSVTAGAADEKLGILTADIVERVERVLDAVAIPPAHHHVIVGSSLDLGAYTRPSQQPISQA